VILVTENKETPTMEIKDNKMQVCPQCLGDGMVYTDVPASGGYDCVYERCETCDAVGEIEVEEEESLQ
jgi:DnaJ-class molecular chaperone